MQLIDRDAINWCDIMPDNPRQLDILAILKSKHFVEKQPVIDAEPVVRCKDCIYYQPSLFGERKMCFRKDVDGVQICYDFLPDDYCSYGIRKNYNAV